MSTGDTEHDFFSSDFIDTNGTRVAFYWFHFCFSFRTARKRHLWHFRGERQTSKSNQLAAKVKMSLLTLAAICFEISARWLALGPGGHFDWRYIWLALWQVVLVAVNQTICQCFYLFSLFLFFHLFARAKVERNVVTLIELTFMTGEFFVIFLKN